MKTTYTIPQTELLILYDLEELMFATLSTAIDPAPERSSGEVSPSGL